MVRGQSTWLITFRYDADIQGSDAITIDGESYEILSIRGPHSYHTALVVLAVKR